MSGEGEWDWISQVFGCCARPPHVGGPSRIVLKHSDNVAPLPRTAVLNQPSSPAESDGIQASEASTEGQGRRGIQQTASFRRASIFQRDDSNSPRNSSRDSGVEFRMSEDAEKHKKEHDAKKADLQRMKGKIRDVEQKLVELGQWWTEMKNKAARAKKPLDEDIRSAYQAKHQKFMKDIAVLRRLTHDNEVMAEKAKLAMRSGSLAVFNGSAKQLSGAAKLSKQASFRANEARRASMASIENNMDM